MTNQKFYSIQQAADRIGCSRATVSRWAKALRLGKVVGAYTILSGAEVIRIDNARRSGPGRPPQKKQAKA